MARETEGDKPFFIRSRDHLTPLETWLRKRRFNCGGHFSEDRNGNPMVSIGWDLDPNNDFKLPDKRGLIIVLDPAILKDVEALVQRLAAKAEA